MKWFKKYYRLRLDQYKGNLYFIKVRQMLYWTLVRYAVTPDGYANNLVYFRSNEKEKAIEFIKNYPNWIKEQNALKKEIKNGYKIYKIPKN